VAKNLFIAATDKDVGKSTISLAFLHRLHEMGKKAAFMKPVGQRWVASKWGPVDEDVVLMKEVFQLDADPVLMNPVVVEKGFTEEYLLRAVKPNLSDKIIDSYKKLAKESDYVVIEGTGHAGVGSVFDHSNAHVARLLDAKVVLVAKGGIGNTIDRLELNRIFFERFGVEVIGVVVNKVVEKKLEKVTRALEIYCEKNRLALFGVIPYSAVLNNPTLDTIIEDIKPQILQEKAPRNLVIDRYIVGAANIEEALNYIKKHKGNIMIIFPADRMDVIFALPKMQQILREWNSKIGALLLNGSRPPGEISMKVLEEEEITVLWKEGDTFSVVSELSGISVKTRSQDISKIEAMHNYVFKNIDYKKVFSRLANATVMESTLGKVKRFLRRAVIFVRFLLTHDIKKFFGRRDGR